jgi:hypothetical protein
MNNNVNRIVSLTKISKYLGNSNKTAKIISYFFEIYF